VKEGNIEVLLIEDSQSDVDLTRFYLASHNRSKYRLTHVKRLKLAVRHIDTGYRPDVILLNLHLPDCRGLDGFRVLRVLVPDVPQVILTNCDDDGLAAAAVREGAQDYLIKKEVDTALLTRSILYAIERQRSDAALRESEERYAFAVAGSNEGIWDWNLANDLAYFSPRWQKLVGCDENARQANISYWFDKVHSDDRPRLEATLKAHFSNTSNQFECTHRVKHKSGEYRWMLARGLAARNGQGSCYRMAGSMCDITEQKKAQDELLRYGLYDGLTNLPNRTLFMDRLEQTIRICRRAPMHRYAVLFLDLDRFKYVNDSFGHSVGDDLLVKVAHRLKKVLRPSDTLARLSGDEFAILLNEIRSPEDALDVAERIRLLLAKAFVLGKHTVYQTASVGITIGTEKYTEPEQVLRDSDLAMYRAKESKDRKVVIFDDQMHASVVARLQLETDLRRAIQQQEFVIHYQPIVCLKTGQVHSFEALLRWQHPTRGLLYPPSFVKVAEEMGLMCDLSWWIIKEAACQTRQWQLQFPSTPPLSIAVNVTGRLFRTAGVAEKLFELLKRSGLAPGHLCLEITETSFMEHQHAVLKEVEPLRAEGVRLHIDDFGTGYSSLSCLQRYSYDTIKIHRTFIQEALETHDAKTIVKAIVTLGKTLHMNIVAEGVENLEQVRFLRHINCPQAQGFWFSAPLPQSEAYRVLERPLRLD
jgi:diguanylate cyclase (GGDEF)-like protein/PAS domain S-box-containing protein